MPDPKLRLYFREPTVDTNMLITDGTFKIEGFEMGENYWAYNIANNRRTLEALTQFAHEQGLSPKRIDYETLFHPEAAALPGS
jgi:hypothetical protein